MKKLNYDELFELEQLLKRFEEYFDGDLPEYQAGGWSRRNLEALIRDISELKRRF